MKYNKLNLNSGPSTDTLHCVIAAPSNVTPVPHRVIPAKAGTQTKNRFLFLDPHLRGDDNGARRDDNGGSGNDTGGRGNHNKGNGNDTSILSPKRRTYALFQKMSHEEYTSCA